MTVECLSELGIGVSRYAEAFVVHGSVVTQLQGSASYACFLDGR